MMWNGLLGRILAILATVVVAGGITLALTGDGPAASDPGAARAWVDDPLDGELVSPGQVLIVGHAYDPEGISEMRLEVDGMTIETTVVSAAGGVLASAQWTWSAGEGIHIIKVIGRNASGGDGLPGRAVIEARRPAPTPEPTTTTTTTTVPPTTTSTTSTTTTTTSPTTTTVPSTTTTAAPPCTPPSPILFEPPDGSTRIGPSPSITFEWNVILFFPVCAPSGYYIEVALDEDFSSVVIDAHLDGTTTEWTPPAMTWGCNVTYHWRVWSKRSDGSLAAVSETRRFSVLCVT